LSGENEPTLCEALPAFQQLITRWEKHVLSHPNTSDFVQAGLDKIEEYFARAELVDVHAYAMRELANKPFDCTLKTSSVVNPHTKLRWYTKYRKDDVPDIKAKILAEMRAYRAADPSLAAHVQPTTAPKRSRYSFDSDDEDELEIAPAAAQPGTITVEVELEQYLALPFPNAEEVTSITFWEVCGLAAGEQHLAEKNCLQHNRTAFPTLYRMALDVLPIQGSAVPCERVFSSAKLTVTPQRNKIGADMMEFLQMLKYTWKKDSFSNSLYTWEEELEILEQESAMIR
jgi:hypothetical protein